MHTMFSQTGRHKEEEEGRPQEVCCISTKGAARPCGEHSAHVCISADVGRIAHCHEHFTVHMQNVRVVQRNLVYAVGLAMEICYEDTLMGPEFFGAYGKMVKQMSVNRMGPYGSAVSRNGPTGSAYITFKRPEDAKRCIEAVNGVTWGGKLSCDNTHAGRSMFSCILKYSCLSVPAGKQVKACFGTTKYCNAFLKGVACNNPECLYLHDIGNFAAGMLNWIASV